MGNLEVLQVQHYFGNADATWLERELLLGASHNNRSMCVPVTKRAHKEKLDYTSRFVRVVRSS